MITKISSWRIAKYCLVVIAVIVTGCIIVNRWNAQMAAPAPHKASGYKIPKQSFCAGSTDSSLPFTINLGGNQLVTIMTIKTEWRPGLFPDPYIILSKGKLEDLQKGSCEDIEIAEDNNWSAKTDQ